MLMRRGGRALYFTGTNQINSTSPTPLKNEQLRLTQMKIGIWQIQRKMHGIV